MKNMISALLIVAAISLATAGHVNAQVGDKDIALIPAKNHAAYVAFINQYGDAGKSASLIAEDTAASVTDEAAKASLKANKANSKAIRNFTTSYKKDASGASWTMEKDVMVASFSKEDVKTNVVYNEKGKWLHTLTYYPENKTPKDIASLMDYSYPKDDVRLSVKVEEGSKIFYIVQLEGKTTLKKVTVYDGDVRLIEELIKSN